MFLDDNPVEREWVRVAASRSRRGGTGAVGVSLRARPGSPARYFFAVSLSAEDQARAEQYRSEAVRKHLQATSQSLDEFLAQLQLRASCDAGQR